MFMKMLGEAAKIGIEKERAELKAKYLGFSAADIQAINLANSQIAAKFARAGVAVFKRWVSLHDGKTRDSHLEADQQFQVLESPFLVGGEKGYYPGDMEFSARQRINCRCIVIFEDVDGRDLLSYRTQKAAKKRIESVLVQIDEFRE